MKWKRSEAGRQWDGKTVGREDGAGSVLAVALIATVLAITLLLVPLYSLLTVRARAAGAADAAALAAADVAVGIVPGVPCEIAASVASANRARLTECQADGVIVTVRVSVTVFGFLVQVAATAGPPGATPK